MSAIILWFYRYKFKLEDGAEVKPFIPLLNSRIYDTKFESQFYMIFDTNKVLCSHQFLYYMINFYGCFGFC